MGQTRQRTRSGRTSARRSSGPRRAHTPAGGRRRPDSGARAAAPGRRRRSGGGLAGKLAHFSNLSWVFFVLGLIGLLGPLMLLGLAGMLTSHGANGMFAAIVFSMAVVVSLPAVLHIAVGCGLARFQGWARIVALILGGLGLLSCAAATFSLPKYFAISPQMGMVAVGILLVVTASHAYTMVVLLPAKAARVYRDQRLLYLDAQLGQGRERRPVLS